MGLSYATLEVICLVLSLLVTVFGFLWRRTRKQLYYYLFLGGAFAQVEASKERDKARPPNVSS